MVFVPKAESHPRQMLTMYFWEHFHSWQWLAQQRMCSTICDFLHQWGYATTYAQPCLQFTNNSSLMLRWKSERVQKGRAFLEVYYASLYSISSHRNWVQPDTERFTSMWFDYLLKTYSTTECWLVKVLSRVILWKEIVWQYYCVYVFLIMKLY